MNSIEQTGEEHTTGGTIRQEYAPLLEEVLKDSDMSLYCKILGLTKDQITKLIQEFYETGQRQDSNDDNGSLLFDDRLREMMYAIKFPQYLSPYFEGCDQNTAWILRYMFSDGVLKTHPTYLKGYFDYIQRFYCKMLGKNHDNLKRKSVTEFLQAINSTYLAERVTLSMADFASYDETSGGKIVLGLIEHNISKGVEDTYDLTYDEITPEQICYYNLLVFFSYGHDMFENDLMVGDILPFINPKTREVNMAYYRNNRQFL